MKSSMIFVFGSTAVFGLGIWMDNRKQQKERAKAQQQQVDEYQTTTIDVQEAPCMVWQRFSALFIVFLWLLLAILYFSNSINLLHQCTIKGPLN